MKIYIFFAVLWLSHSTFDTVVSPRHMLRDDGTEVIYYHDVVDDNNDTLFVIIQGGACISVPQQLERMSLFADLDFKADTLWVEKYGLTNEGRFSECPQAYIENNTPLQRVDDYVLVLNKIARHYKRIIILGVREGAAILSILLADEKIPISEAIALNTGAGSYANDMIWQIEQVGPLEDLALINPVISKFLEQDTNKERSEDVRFLNHNYRWWYEMLNTNMYSTLKNNQKPLLIIQGLADRYLLQDNKNTPYGCLIQKDNVTVYYYEDLNHELANSFDVAEVSDIVRDIKYWLEHLTHQ